MDEVMETNSDKSRMNSQPTDNSKNANAAHFSTLTTPDRPLPLGNPLGES
jgi:hypothetical protein